MTPKKEEWGGAAVEIEWERNYVTNRKFRTSGQKELEEGGDQRRRRHTKGERRILLDVEVPVERAKVRERSTGIPIPSVPDCWPLGIDNGRHRRRWVGQCGTNRHP